MESALSRYIGEDNMSNELKQYGQVSNEDLPTIDDIRTEFEAFYRAGSSIVITQRKRNEWQLDWEQERRTRKTHARIHNGVWQFSEHKTGSNSEATWVPHSQFLASQQLADLRYLAEQILQSHVVPNEVETYIDTEAIFESIDHGEESTRHGLVDGLRKQTTDAIRGNAQAEEKMTQVFFLRGEAGSGKSISLRQLTRQQAIDYCDGKTDFLFLYIDAQGQALNTLNTVFSSVLMDLTVTTIRKETIAVLCRHGLIVPVIDGFDELLGAGGYGETFNSLSAFLASLSGRGVVIASGRSTFYDDQYLQIAVSRFETSRLDYNTSTATVLPWSKSQLRNFIASKTSCDAEDDRGRLISQFENIISDSRYANVLGKPFYATRVIELLRGEKLSLANNQTPIIEFLITDLIEREMNRKLLSRQAGTPIWNAEQHRQFLKEVAREMWLTVSQELPAEDIRTLAEILGSQQKLSAEDRRVVISRAPMHAAFASERGRATGSVMMVCFHHVIYFDYFILCTLRDLLQADEDEGTATSYFLEKGLLSESLLDLFAEYATDAEVLIFVRRLCSSMRPGGRYALTRRNGGGLLASLLTRRALDLHGLCLKYFDFSKVEFLDLSVSNVTFEECLFDDVKFNSSNFQNSKFVRCLINRIVVYHTTMLDASMDIDTHVLCVLVKGPQGERACRTPLSIRKCLQEIGCQIERAKDRDLEDHEESEELIQSVNILERFLRHMTRTRHFSEDQGIRWGLSGMPIWSTVVGLLRKHQVLIPIPINKSVCPRVRMEELSVPVQQILDGQNLDAVVDAPVTEFWRELRETLQR